MPSLLNQLGNQPITNQSPDQFKIELPKEADQWNQILFISDTDLDESIRKQLEKYSNIQEFDKKLFANRDSKQIVDLGINKLWVNVKGKNARIFISENIQDFNTSWKIVLCYKNNPTDSWVEDLVSFSHAVLSVDKLKSLRSLSIDELINKIRTSSVKITPPPITCLGFTLFNSKKNEQKK